MPDKFLIIFKPVSCIFYKLYHSLILTFKVQITHKSLKACSSSVICIEAFFADVYDFALRPLLYTASSSAGLNSGSINPYHSDCDCAFTILLAKRLSLLTCIFPLYLKISLFMTRSNMLSPMYARTSGESCAGEISFNPSTFFILSVRLCCQALFHLTPSLVSSSTIP